MQHYAQPVVVIGQTPTSGTATAALIFGIIGALGGWCMLGIPCVLAIIAGHIALPQTSNGSRGGRGMAVTGLILGYLFVAPTVLFVLLGGLGAVVDATVPDPMPSATP